MANRKKWILMGLPLLIIAGVAAFLLCCGREGFAGSRVKNPDAYLLDIRQMTGADSHSLRLQEGDALQIRFETEKGTLRMTITAPDGSALYCGNGEAATDFTVNIPASGVYTATVEARGAQGTIHIRKKPMQISTG